MNERSPSGSRKRDIRGENIENGEMFRKNFVDMKDLSNKKQRRTKRTITASV